MSLFAKGHKRNPRTTAEQAKIDAEQADTRTYIEKVNDEKAEFGISEMTDEELAQFNADNPYHEAGCHEKRIRRNAKNGTSYTGATGVWL